MIGENGVAVPTRYFKFVVSKYSDNSGTLEAIAFLVPNEPMKGDFRDYLVSIDEIERLPGYEFLPFIEDSQEEALEAVVAEEVWGLDSVG